MLVRPGCADLLGLGSQQVLIELLTTAQARVRNDLGMDFGGGAPLDQSISALSIAAPSTLPERRGNDGFSACFSQR